MTLLYCVWKAHYATYEELAVQGEIKPQLVQKDLTFEVAQDLVKKLGFGYSIRPQY